ncbi:winged helix-turn-helix domain-containing protein [Pseudomonas chlororaphis subsp. aurantiaca]|uniref:winged helix-turn-helix domain-containing protein n=1 Tax=Pseudomonas chlororaphis TaxID=587753 RepID=UPI0027DAFF5C|nr:winged helix-turn-helix domain-containing protein [Pseudomonas chlororaphis]WMI97610.1 winged helix-turn-helix domain-containing protein [Pseudomonas chlororaphis subsp. aurantiaca]
MLYTLTLLESEENTTLDLGFSGGRLLERLMQDPGQVIDRDTLTAYAWTDRVVGPGSLNQQIYTLRKLLADEKHRQIIQTVPRRGYRFNPAFVISQSAPAVVENTACAAPPPPPVTSRPTTRRKWAVSAIAAVLVVGYGLTTRTNELHASLQKTDDTDVVYIAEKMPKVQELIRVTRNLSHRLVRLSKKPVELAIVDVEDGYYQVSCSIETEVNHIRLAEEEINTVSDIRLLDCVDPTS